MTTTIITKNSSTASAVPLAADLTQGELAVNVTDKRVYTKDASAAVVELGINPTSVTTGNVTISGTGKRITGDFSNATEANRVLFQTSTVDGSTNIGLIPNGVGTGAIYRAYNNSSASNCARAVFGYVGGTSELGIRSEISGTGTYLPITTYVGGFENTRQPTTGGFTITASAGLGYGTGSGGTVTQATSKSTTVTLNKPTGQITMNNSALGAGASVSFIFNNSLITGNDLMIVNTVGGSYSTAGAYRVQAEAMGAGTSYVTVTNQSAGSLSEALKINFAIIKGAIA